MEKKRIKLDINGVVCGIITEEPEEYIEELAAEVRKTMTGITSSSPMITRESAAVMTALSFIDESRKSEEKVARMKDRLTETERKALELERRTVELQKQNKQLWEETEALLKEPASGALSEEKQKLESRVFELEKENDRLRKSIEQSGAAAPAPQEEKRDKSVPLKNPLRSDDLSGENFISFFEKNEE